MRRICVINQKGGVGKTTTAVNLAAGLSRKGKSVLLVDLDPQGNATFSLQSISAYDLYDFLTSEVEIKECVTNLGKNLDLLGAKESLVEIETEMAKTQSNLNKFAKKLKGISGYDYVVVDCSPMMGPLSDLAILSTDEAVVPTSTDVLGLRGTSNTLKMIEKTNKRFGHTLKVTKIVPTLFDKRNRVCKKTLEIMNNIYYDIISEPIRVNARLKEAPERHMSIFRYAKGSRGAEDYNKLVLNVLNDEKHQSKITKENSVAALT
ncbi:MAG: ParA family protein [Candidatus Nanoarchaeia archaeon]